jgi:hypothetical protein
MRTLLEQFTGRRHSPLVQFVKYAIAGAIATAVQVSLFYLFALKLLPALNGRDLLVGRIRLLESDGVPDQRRLGLRIGAAPPRG